MIAVPVGLTASRLLIAIVAIVFIKSNITPTRQTENMADTPNYDEVPTDYPCVDIASAVGGTQPKFAMVKFEGKFYIPGNTPPERRHDWAYSESLVQHFVKQCPETKRGKRAHMSEHDIIAQYFERAVAAGGRYGTEAQLRWAFRRVAELLGWPVPGVCKEPDQ
ncbi:hypothetical protein ASE07_05155 [Noviherbaspirillum sp. Root189]|nr:hypothetical protein ASE07_05155 [Noviherbaspirillum sp. Root189]